MNDTVLTLAVLGAGGALAGWWLGRQPAARQRRVALGALALLALPVAALLLAGVIGSDTLGWIAGLSLMLGLAAALPLLAGVALGWLAARRSRSPHAGGPAASPVPPPAPAAAAPEPPPIVVPRHTPAQRLGLLMVMAGVAAGFVVVLGLGFRLHGQPAPGVLHGALWPALAVLLALTVPAGRWIGRQLRTRDARRRADALYRDWRTERERWLQQLAADPRRQPYLARIERGEHWTPERVDYDLDPDARACCPHLQPVDAAMRLAGLRVLPIAERSVQADCTIDTDALARRFVLPACVSYSEPQRQDRQGDGEMTALLRCSACASMLWALHASQARAGTPRFPGGSNN